MIDLDQLLEPGPRQVQSVVRNIVKTVMVMEKTGVVTPEVMKGLRSLLRALTS